MCCKVRHDVHSKGCWRRTWRAGGEAYSIVHICRCSENPQPYLIRHIGDLQDSCTAGLIRPSRFSQGMREIGLQQQVLTGSVLEMPRTGGSGSWAASLWL